jgi:FMN-dependent NADH-azoreductase
MKNILLVLSSPRGDQSYSNRVARELVAKLQSDHPGATVKTVDVSQLPPPVLDGAQLHAFFTPSEARTEEQRAAIAQSDAYVADIFFADTIVIASGMINFSVPATLKAWIDQIVRGGVTFRYGEGGPEGLVQGKKVYLVLATGGVYSSGPMQAMDHLSPYLASTLAFLGMTDVETIRVEGTAFGPEAAETAVQAAQERVAALVA